VVGVDVQADGTVTLRQGKGGAAGSQGFGQHHAHAAVQQAIRLAGVGVDRHAGANEVVADFQEFNAQAGHRGVDVDGVKDVDRDGLFPEGHGSASSFQESAIVPAPRLPMTANGRR
jgi:hypothetical protein